MKFFYWRSAKNAAAAEPYGAIGLICQELGTPREGLAFVEAGLKRHPDNPDLLYYAGSNAPARYWVRFAIAENLLGRREQAEAAFRAALEQEPSSTNALFQLGKHFLSEKRYAAAEHLLERAVRLAPAMREAYYSYGLALMRNGKAEKGRVVLARHRRRQVIRDSQIRSGGMAPP